MPASDVNIHVSSACHRNNHITEIITHIILSIVIFVSELLVHHGHDHEHPHCHHLCTTSVSLSFLCIMRQNSGNSRKPDPSTSTWMQSSLSTGCQLSVINWVQSLTFMFTTAAWSLGIAKGFTSKHIQVCPPSITVLIIS